METPWTRRVNVSNPLSNYPRPQLVRSSWISLNGIWQLDTRQVWEAGDDPPFGKELPLRIVVPFPVEAPLSGVGQHNSGMAVLWYRREFAVPADWKAGGQRVKLNFGAVDWDTTVYVNGQKLGNHRGGYDKFAFDITGTLEGKGRGPHELLIRVSDPTEFGHIPIGKQRLHPPRHPSSIFYTSSTGIWQTVWLEPVPAAHVTHVTAKTLEPGLVAVTVKGSPAAAGLPFKNPASAFGRLFEAFEEGSMAGESVVLNISHPHMWSPDDPFLYDLEVVLEETRPKSLLPQLGGWETVEGDRVQSYFGMRTIELKRVGSSGKLRPALNGEFIFQIGMLDQGFWPDGIYTAPMDVALVHDIELAKSMGFNLLRKHVKVEPDRWYYHADRLGMLVWQDMPSMFWEEGMPHQIPTPAQQQFEHELARLIEEHENSPSIIAYVVFNEGWGQYDTERVVQAAQALDPSRLYDCASGWTDFPVGSFVDLHEYVGPGSPVPTASRAAVLGEFGGLGLDVVNHSWIPEEAFSYELQASASALERRYLGLVEALKQLMVEDSTSLSAAVYTELSDVEAEINGFTTYDRQVIKVQTKALASAHKELLELSRLINDPSVKVSYWAASGVGSASSDFWAVLMGAITLFTVGLALILTYHYAVSRSLAFGKLRRVP
eukprot:jgi/Botrbrau1/18336/Bobra.0179s0063.1